MRSTILVALTPMSTALWLAAAPTASASIVTYQFTGTVWIAFSSGDLSVPAGVIGNGLPITPVDSKFAGIFSYDTADNLPIPVDADTTHYQFNNSGSLHFGVTMARLAWSADLGAIETQSAGNNSTFSFFSQTPASFSGTNQNHNVIRLTIASNPGEPLLTTSAALPMYSIDLGGLLNPVTETLLSLQAYDLTNEATQRALT